MPFEDYENKDIYGNDCGYYPQKSVEELKLISSMIQEAIGFNDLGYVKSYCSDSITCNHTTKLYIDKSKIQNILKDKKNIASGNIKKNITFVVTTCKRLDFFIESINNFLYYCQDIYCINRWLCIDDNSSEEDRVIMKKTFPFFEFIFKNKDEKGHAKSLNIMLDKVKTKYIFMFEDDWVCMRKFYISSYIKFLQENNFDQVIFHDRTHTDVKYKILKIVDGINVYEYSYNPDNKCKKEVLEYIYNKYIEFEKKFNVRKLLIERKTDSTEGYHYPGFSLNPSIFSIEKIKKNNLYFNEDNAYNDIFELYFSFQCFVNNMKISFSPIKINHIGSYNSAYVLNDKKRVFDIHDKNLV